MALIKVIGPAVGLMVNHDPRPAVAPQRDLFGAVASLVLKTQSLQMLPGRCASATLAANSINSSP